MNILVLSTSPRKSFSTSLYFSKILKNFLAGHNVEIISLKSVRDYNKAVARLADIDTLVFATPVYVDSIPSTTLEYLERMEQHVVEKKYTFNVYTITNCGFYEGHQCELALKTYDLWCEHAGVEFLGGVGIGSGVMLGFIRVLPVVGLVITGIELLIHAIQLFAAGSLSLTLLFLGFFPFSLVTQAAIWLLFSLGAFIKIFKLRSSIVRKQNHIIEYTTVWFCPRFLFVAMASIYWVLRALLLHGVLPWELYKASAKSKPPA